MARTVSIGNQDFGVIMEHQYFYIDKNTFSQRMVGKRRCCHTDYPSPALWKNSEHEHDRILFSVKHAGRTDLFESLSIWKEEKYRQIQGTFPVISFPLQT